MHLLTKKYTSLQLKLIGAGPGDPELITLKAIRALQNSKSVLYDALVNEELLNHIPTHVPKLFVGKRSGQHSMPQDEINRLIVEYAYRYGEVVRLKGGDPFVFGRGHEELTYAQKFGIDVEVIPGISSSIAVPELQHIPLTKRGVNESFWVITGTTRSGKLSDDIALAAQSSSTVIILMGMKKLKEIQQAFEKYGKKNTAFAIIQNGSLPNEKIGIGRVYEMAALAEKKQLDAPAIIIIGEVVESHKDFQKNLLQLLENNYELLLN